MKAVRSSDSYSRRIGELAHNHELVARLGDDEFAMFLPALVALAGSAAASETPSPIRRNGGAQLRPRGKNRIRVNVPADVAGDVGFGGHQQGLGDERRLKSPVEQHGTQRFNEARSNLHGPPRP